MCFKQMARPKYDKGQKEKGTNLDDHTDLVGAIREELVDGWFYLDSLAKQIDDKNSRIAERQGSHGEDKVEHTPVACQ